jgi:hypothetical protein
VEAVSPTQAPPDPFEVELAKYLNLPLTEIVAGSVDTRVKGVVRWTQVAGGERRERTVRLDPAVVFHLRAKVRPATPPSEDQLVIGLLCQTLKRTGFRTMNGEPFEEWARARVRAGDYPEKP